MTVENYLEELSLYIEAIKAIKVPSEFDYKLAAVRERYKSMFNRFCPYQIGDRVRLIKAPAISDNSGWAASKHFLILGAEGEIRKRNYYKDKFIFEIVFDNETYIDHKGVKISVKEKSHFTFSEFYLESIR